jgi:Protein of unknown function (DUF3015)
LMVPATSFADNVGGCGWGSKLMDGNGGIAPQVLAVTTNGTSGNQTFGITSGTSGCTQSGTVQSNWQTASFVSPNMNKIAKNISVGDGETLQAWTSMMGMNDADSKLFSKLAKENFSEIFASTNTTTEDVMVATQRLLASNKKLEKYSNRI